MLGPSQSWVSGEWRDDSNDPRHQVKTRLARHLYHASFAWSWAEVERNFPLTEIYAMAARVGHRPYPCFQCFQHDVVHDRAARRVSLVLFWYSHESNEYWRQVKFLFIPLMLEIRSIHAYLGLVDRIFGKIRTVEEYIRSTLININWNIHLSAQKKQEVVLDCKRWRWS